MNKLSVIILTHNSENTIKQCISSVSFADEIIIIDDYSDDKTLSIASDSHAVIFQHKLHNDFSKQRNFGLSKTSHEWVLFLDSDECVTHRLSKEILNVLSRETDINGYYLKREDIMWGKRLKSGEIGTTRLLRLGKKDKGRWEGRVHEIWKIQGKTGELFSPLLHFPHRSIGEFLTEINMYTSLRADELFKKQTPVSLPAIVCYPVGKFILNYFIRLGCLDGIQGLMFAITMSFHSFLVRAKLWQRYDQKKSHNV